MWRIAIACALVAGAGACKSSNNDQRLTADAPDPDGAPPPPAPFASVVQAGYGGCALTAAHELWCWPDASASSPTPSRQAGHWLALDEATPSCAIRDDGTAWCLTTNLSGYPPTQPFGGGDDIAALDGTCALHRDGTFACGGITSPGTTTWLAASSNDPGVACAIDTQHHLVCFGIAPRGTSDGLEYPGSDWATITGVGASRTCGLKLDGTLWCFGATDHGYDTTPTELVTGAHWTSVSVAGDHGCATRDDDTLWCWGDNHHGQLGLGTTTTTATMPRQVGSDAVWAHMSAHADGTCGIQRDGSLWCWGFDDGGEVGTGQPGEHLTASLAGAWKKLAPSSEHVCGLETDGTLWCWGRDFWGQLGDGNDELLHNTNADRELPQQVAGSWLDVAAGGGTTCALRDDHTLWCWGYQLGIWTVASPTQIDGAWAQLAVADNHACAITTTGSLACWGSNSFGQLGTGDTSDATAPVPVGGTAWAQVSVGTNNTCALQTDHSLWCWGANEWSQIGDGTTTERHAPTQIAGVTWRAVATSGGNTCATQMDDSLWCWGSNGYGSCGDTQLGVLPTPHQVVGSWSAVALAPNYATCATKTDGTLWCWGLERDARGDFSGGYYPAPTQLPGSDYAQLAQGANLCATTSAGAATCWGSNHYGMLGDGTEWRTAPVRISE